MYNKLSWVFCGLFAGFLITGCKNYSVSVNENIVYTPPSIFKDYQLADERLHDCVEQTIYDQRITRAEDLTHLNCSNAGIKSIAGLEKFFALTELNLADNHLVDINPVSKLGRLEKLILKNNRIATSAPLLHLLHLTLLDIEANPSIECKDLAQLKHNLATQKTTLMFPTHCSGR